MATEHDQGWDEEEEARRLITAFYKIEDRQARRIILAIVEAAARGAAIKIEEPSELGMAILGRGSPDERTSH